MIIMQFFAVAAIGYLLGAIPFGLIVSRLTANMDITRHGSGNIGGTNVMRILGLGPGAVVMVMDVAKAFAAVIIARLIFTGGAPLFWGFPPGADLFQIAAEIAAAFAAMIGHNWSVYIKFRGGKGVAAYFGGWLVLCPMVALIGGAVTLVTVFSFRIMSRSSILGSITTLVLLIVLIIWFGASPAYLTYSVLATALIVFQHRRNISRLQNGTELKLDETVLKGQASSKQVKENGEK